MSATRAYVPPMITMPRMNPPNERPDALAEEVGFVGVGRRHQPHQEAADRRPVDRDEDREEEDDQQVADDPDARDGDLLQGPEKVLGLGGERLQDRVDLGRDVHLVEAERAQPVDDRLQERHEVALKRRQVLDELGRRGDERRCGEDDEPEGPDRDGAVGDGHRDDPRHEAGQPGRDRLEDEAEEPGEEEDEDQVAEDRPDAGQLPEDDEEEGDRAQHEDDGQQAAVARREEGLLAGGRRRRQQRGGRVRGRRTADCGGVAAGRSIVRAIPRSSGRTGPERGPRRARVRS